eukprot:CAMPEP_0204201482 /NCGR_PEP_ID=MMETSP0361-20130328/67505_1 /ASSEMBLY_ACC=CAM_ASM_000343 /TAXON_ID=268821 /ORGANISM="Scrippsiella Hangoei, Strain SHTV-5" /LENGTH=59 /DNA_ID=CAMNT_0051164129 /DNA_START=54 /DNA_END=233 /DNA_ORIENTATION=+
MVQGGAACPLCAGELRLDLCPNRADQNWHRPTAPDFTSQLRVRKRWEQFSKSTHGDLYH